MNELLRLLTWAKEYSKADNQMYYIVRKLGGRLGIYNSKNIPAHCTVLYNIYNTEVYCHRENMA